MTDLNAGPQPPAAPQTTPPAPNPTRQKNTLGLVAVIVAAVGFVFACIPGALIVGWILLPIGFILSIVGLALSGRKKATSITALILSVVGTIVGVVVFLTVTAGAVGDALNNAHLSPDDADATSAAQDAAAPHTPAGPTAKATAAAQGTRAHPLAVGQKASNRDWTVSLGTPREATDAVLKSNEFNTPPAKGKEDWIVPVTATYTGDDTGEPALISVNFVSADGHTYDVLNADCGVIDAPLDSVGKLYPNATAKGDICLQVPAGADGLWNVTTGLLDQHPVFFTAQQ